MLKKLTIIRGDVLIRMKKTGVLLIKFRFIVCNSGTLVVECH